MAAQQREKEETELKVPESIPLCSQTLPVPAPPLPHTAVTRSPQNSDLNLSSSNESRSSSGNLPEMIDLKFFSTDESRSSSDLKLFGTGESRSSSGSTPERIDLKHSGKYESRSKLSGRSLERIDLKLAGTNESRLSSLSSGRSLDSIDLKFSGIDESMFSSGISPESIDLKFSGINESRFSSDSVDLKISGTNESRSSSGISPVDLKLFSTGESISISGSSSERIYLKFSGTNNSRSSSGSSIDPKLSDTDELRSTSAISPENSRKSGVKREREVNRCSGIGCRRKVGLMSFRCRCGEVFCSEHRYSDRHDCSYDYKAAGRETIARENPIVKAAKILKV